MCRRQAYFSNFPGQRGTSPPKSPIIPATFNLREDVMLPHHVYRDVEDIPAWNLIISGLWMTIPPSSRNIRMKFLFPTPSPGCRSHFIYISKNSAIRITTIAFKGKNSLIPAKKYGMLCLPLASSPKAHSVRMEKTYLR
jgi:hypothetical protein